MTLLRQAGSLTEYTEANGIPATTLDIHEGDFYLFNSGLIHEVPSVIGDDPRVLIFNIF